MNYSQYISHFYPGALTNNDRDFLRSLYERNEMDYNAKIDNPDAILFRLDNSDFVPPYILNKTLLEHAIRNSSRELWYMLLPLTSGNLDIKKLDRILSEFSHDILARFVNQMLSYKGNKYILDSLMHQIQNQCDNDSKVNVKLASGILSSDCVQEEHLTSLTTWFQDWKGLAYYLAIDDEDAFQKNLEKLEQITEVLALELLNSTLPTSSRVNILDRNHESIDKISDISKLSCIKKDKSDTAVLDPQEVEIVEKLLQYDLVSYTIGNINRYLIAVDYNYSSHFLNFLENHIDDCEVLLESKELGSKLLLDSHISDDLFEIIINDIKKNYNSYSRYIYINNEIIETISIERLNSICLTPIPVPLKSTCKRLIDNSYFDTVINIIARDPDATDQSDDMVELLNYYLYRRPEADELYDYINSDTPDNKIISVIIECYKDIDLSRVNEEVINTHLGIILKHNLSKENIEHLVSSFDELDEQLTLIKYLLSDKVYMPYIDEAIATYGISSNDIKLDKRIGLLCQLLDICNDFSKQMNAIRQIPEVADLANIEQNGRPAVDSDQKKTVAEKMIDIGIAKRIKSESRPAIMRAKTE